MSEWRGNLHPRDRSGRFRASLERLANELKAEGRVEFDGGAVARDRRGNWLSVPTKKDAPKGQHRSARGAVDRMVGLGLAHPGRLTRFESAVEDRARRALAAGSPPHAVKVASYLAGRSLGSEDHFPAMIAGDHAGIARAVDRELSGWAYTREGNLADLRAAKAELGGRARPRLSKTATGGRYTVKLADGSRKTVKAASSRKAMKSVKGAVFAVPAMASPGVGNVRAQRLAGEVSKITPEVRAQMETRNIAHATGFKGDRVASAASALVDLYRAQEGQGSGAAALARVRETWAGLSLEERSRARRVAQHLHDAGSNLLRPTATKVA